MLRHEIDGSSDQAAWVPLGSVPDLLRTPLLDVALDLYRRQPPEGRSELA
jgi:8-oxo-dGTP diphosphatase